MKKQYDLTVTIRMTNEMHEELLDRAAYITDEGTVGAAIRKAVEHWMRHHVAGGDEPEAKAGKVRAGK